MIADGCSGAGAAVRTIDLGATGLIDGSHSGCGRRRGVRTSSVSEASVAGSSVARRRNGTLIGSIDHVSSCHLCGSAVDRTT